jgi:hypothetical protein
MPRGPKRTLTGQQAQKVQAVPGQAYGQGVQQEQLQQVLPAPKIEQQPAPPAMSAAGAASAQTAPPPGYDHNAALAAAQQMPGSAGLLAGDTTKPNEPVTAGLTRGPGAGPEALGLMSGTPTGDLFRRLSAISGDPFFAELANRSRN